MVDAPAQRSRSVPGRSAGGGTRFCACTDHCSRPEPSTVRSKSSSTDPPFTDLPELAGGPPSFRRTSTLERNVPPLARGVAHAGQQPYLCQMRTEALEERFDASTSDHGVWLAHHRRRGRRGHCPARASGPFRWRADRHVADKGARVDGHRGDAALRRRRRVEPSRPPTRGSDPAESAALADALFRGEVVRYLDTSNSYGGGESERRIGTALRAAGASRPDSSCRPRRTATWRPATSPGPGCASRSPRAWSVSASLTCRSSSPRSREHHVGAQPRRRGPVRPRRPTRADRTPRPVGRPVTLTRSSLGDSRRASPTTGRPCSARREPLLTSPPRAGSAYTMRHPTAASC